MVRSLFACSMAETSLMQTAGRAARHASGRVIMYADRVTDSMAKVIATTRERRERQTAYNTAHGIEPTTVRRAIRDSLHIYQTARETEMAVFENDEEYDVSEVIQTLEKEMLAAAEKLEFERAALLRDQIRKLSEGES